MESEGEFEDMYVNIRPYLKQCITALKSIYQIIVLTASTQDYADTILDYIDPDFELFEGRYYREH
jgi:TFIIF-interacting CTD phosphatase-like protein